MINILYADENRYNHAIVGGYGDYTIGLVYADRSGEIQAGFFRHGNNTIYFKI